MRNEITITGTTDAGFVTALNDGTNRLYVNGEEVQPTEWVGEGTYTTTAGGVTITIEKAPSTAGNIQIVQTGNYAYALRRTTGAVTADYVDGHVQPVAYERKGDAKTLTQSMANMPMTDGKHTYGVPGYYRFKTDSGIEVLKSGAYIISGYIMAGSLTAGDVIAARYHIDRTGTDTNGNSHYGVATNYATAEITRTIEYLEQGDTVYIQARNVTAARGNLAGGNLMLEWVGEPNE